jgi:hypothetical protein
MPLTHGVSLPLTDDQLQAQITSCLMSRAALFNKQDKTIPDFALATVMQILGDWKRKPERMKDKLAQARVRYGTAPK